MKHRFQRICDKCHTLEQAVRLWNWIDHQDDPEWMWNELMAACPWAFASLRSFNSIRFGDLLPDGSDAKALLV